MLPQIGTLKMLKILDIIKPYILSILLHQVLLAGDYTLSGVVFDLEKNQPISNVNVFLGDKGQGTSTDKNGYFLLLLENHAPNSQITLSVSAIGFKEKNIEISLTENNIKLGQINLESTAIELDAIKIRCEVCESSQISDITLSGKELNETLKGNIATTLANQPNIGVNSFGIITSKPSLRGFSGDRFLLTKDGGDTGDLSQSSIDLVISLDMTEVDRI